MIHEIQGHNKWSAFVDGGDGFFYGIHSNTRHVVKFNPPDKSCFGDGRSKWICGVRANTGSIYCAPFNAKHMLKINTIDGTGVETLDDIELPETGGRKLWVSGALAQDTNIYYMPYSY